MASEGAENFDVDHRGMRSKSREESAAHCANSLPSDIGKAAMKVLMIALFSVEDP
jgi:hypothetical protein